LSENTKTHSDLSYAELLAEIAYYELRLSYRYRNEHPEMVDADVVYYRDMLIFCGMEKLSRQGIGFNVMYYIGDHQRA